jgi:hypothetical protein
MSHETFNKVSKVLDNTFRSREKSRTNQEFFSNNTLKLVQYTYGLMGFIVVMYFITSMVRPEASNENSNLFFGVLGVLGTIVATLVTNLVTRQNLIPASIQAQAPTNTKIEEDKP